MKSTFRKSFGVSAVILGALALLVLPSGSRAGEVSIPERPDLPSECEVVILPVPGPDHCGKPPVDDPVSILPVPADPPVSILPVDRVGNLRLWIVRRGEGFRSVIVPCGPRCPLAQSLLGASKPLPSRHCRSRQGTVRAGGLWQGRRIGPFHNRTTCDARKWQNVAGVFNRLLPR